MLLVLVYSSALHKQGMPYKMQTLPRSRVTQVFRV
jgi:hypothetical protein